MKVKKIRGIEKTVCSCEQKISYNYAFSYRHVLEEIHKSDNITMVKNDAYQQVIDMVISNARRLKIDKKYNIDAIIHAFRNGIESYLQTYSILSSYEDIGRVFPILYNIE